MEFSKQDLTYLDPEDNTRYVPHVVEPSFGLDRLLLALLCDAYDEEQLEKDTRIVMHLQKGLSPYDVAILPLSNKLSSEAEAKVFNLLAKRFNCTFDVTGSIGKRYRRQDAIGTPYCITFDFDSLEDNKVTVRDRDSMEQVRISIDELNAYLNEKFGR